MSTDAGGLNIRIQAGAALSSSGRRMVTVPVERTEPVQAAQPGLGPTGRVGPGRAGLCSCSTGSNYPVLCHPADELITVSACFPLNLESALLARAHIHTHTHKPVQQLSSTQQQGTPSAFLHRHPTPVG